MRESIGSNKVAGLSTRRAGIQFDMERREKSTLTKSEPPVEPDQPDTVQQNSFGDSNEVDPTPGWIPFVFVIAIAAVFLMCFVLVAVLMG